MGIKIESNNFVKVLAIVAGMAFIMISIAYGITYIFEGGKIKFPIASYYILILFAIGFVLFSVFFENVRGAVYPWSLLEGAVASAGSTFIVTAAIGGMLYIWEKGFSGLGIDTVLYAFSISIILSMILYSVIRRMDIKLESKHFVRELAVVGGIAFLMMISTVYGINYMRKIDMFPIPPYLILLMFAIGFVIAPIFYEKRGAIHPWSLLGGAIASACIIFIITAAVGGMRYIWEKGFRGLDTDTLVYSLSICIILSMILLNLARHKL